MEIIFLGKNDKEVPTVKKFKTLITGFINTRLGFIITLLFCYWLKTLWAYHTDFSLDLGNAYQVFLTIINPIPLALLLLGFALYIKNTRALHQLLGCLHHSQPSLNIQFYLLPRIFRLYHS